MREGRGVTDLPGAAFGLTRRAACAMLLAVAASGVAAAPPAAAPGAAPASLAATSPSTSTAPAAAGAVRGSVIRFLEDRVRRDPEDTVALNRLAGEYHRRF